MCKVIIKVNWQKNFNKNKFLYLIILRYFLWSMFKFWEFEKIVTIKNNEPQSLTLKFFGKRINLPLSVKD